MNESSDGVYIGVVWCWVYKIKVKFFFCFIVAFYDTLTKNKLSFLLFLCTERTIVISETMSRKMVFLYDSPISTVISINEANKGCLNTENKNY